MNARKFVVYGLLVGLGFLAGYLTHDRVKALGGRPQVSVLGAVRNPGMYTLAKHSQVDDAIREAGGVTEEADLTQIDFSEPVADGQKIYVARKTANHAPSVSNLIEESKARSQKKALPAGSININTASLSELDALPGVGPAIAQRIIDYRSAHGKFHSVEEIKNVKGIGDKTFEKLKNYITVD